MFVIIRTIHTLSERSREPVEPFFKITEVEKEQCEKVGDDLDVTDHGIDNPLIKLLTSDTGDQISKNLDIVEDMLSKEDNDNATSNMLRGAYCVVDPCKYCMELKSMYPDHFIDCSGNAKMDEFKYLYLRETPVSMSNAHNHSVAIMSCNDRQTYRFLLDKIFSVRYIDRALIIKAFVDNELV